MNQTAMQMLRCITHSKNESCAEVAQKYLMGEWTEEQARAYSGGFMDAVLNGDYVAAWMKADGENQRALEKIHDMSLRPTFNLLKVKHGPKR